MLVLAAVVISWFAVALVVAVLLGRAAARADREELGSDIHWDHQELTALPARSPA